MPPKVDRNKFRIRKKENETIIKYPGDIDGKDFCISHCENCDIYLCDYFEQVFVDDSRNCRVFIGPTRGSIFMRECEDMKLYSASQQLRISDSKNIIASVYAGSDPALENVTGLKVAPFNFNFPGVAEFFEKANLDPNDDYWSQVFDFTPNKQGQRNWELLNPQEYEGQIQKQLEGFDQPLQHPVQVSAVYGGSCEKEIVLGSRDPSAQQDASGMMSFNIQTSQKQAASQMESTKQQDQQQQEQQSQEQQQQQQQNQQQVQNQQQQEVKKQASKQKCEKQSCDVNIFGRILDAQVVVGLVILKKPLLVPVYLGISYGVNYMNNLYGRIRNLRDSQQ